MLKQEGSFIEKQNPILYIAQQRINEKPYNVLKEK